MLRSSNDIDLNHVLALERQLVLNLLETKPCRTATGQDSDIAAIVVGAEVVKGFSYSKINEQIHHRIELERKYEMAKATLRKTNQALWEALFSDRINLHPDDLDQIRYKLPTKAILLEIATLEDQIAIFLCSPNAPVILKSVPMKNASKRIKGLLLQYRQVMSSPSVPTSAQQIGKRLYDIILAPVITDIEHLKPETILFAPSGILRYVSLATLYDGHSYMVEKYTSANVSGFDILRLGNQRQLIESKIQFIGFSNPDGTLPESDKECAEIGKAFESCTLYSQHNATLQKFLALSGNASIVHLATHGVLDTERPEESYLVFADDKLYYKDMVAGIPLMKHLGLLTLSACNTANVNATSMNNNAMEIYGIAYQFVRKTNAGATIATLWPVSDEHSRELMSVMYSNLHKNLLQVGNWQRGESLALAQRHLLSNPDTRHPFYWGAFVLIGNYD